MSQPMQTSASWKRVLPVVLAAMVLLAQGYVYGLWTNRWQGTGDALKAASERLEQIPMVLGDWQGTQATALGERERQQAGFAGYISRSYKNIRTGASVSILLACGRPGPISVHTPDICYRGAGYQPTNAIAKHAEKLNDAEVAMWQANFRKADGLSPTHLRVLWSWTKGAAWEAPENPRLAFAGAPALYKLYVIQETLPNDSGADKVRSEFLNQLVPELNKRLAS